MYGYGGRETEKITSVFISPHYDVGAEFYISYDLQDILNPNFAPVTILGIHSPFDAQFSEIELELGKKYEVQIRVEQHRLLSSPYTTDCRDYLHEFASNNFTGPWSKQICLQLCNIQPYFDACGCFPLKLLNNGKMLPFDLLCQTDEEYICSSNVSVITEERDKCYFSCKNDCVKWVYYADVVERMQTFIEDYSITGVVLRLKESSLTVMSYKPKYELTEIVSCIGGYLAFWLGFCTISLADFLLSLFKTSCKQSNRP
ncbi:uncharacterized protein LOC129224980 [Uloborus diversus]|uniref:uncharacterized protein LOC129224980 n=1 Tax=Uloborus diversus TaxID=327109 RepID=UPI0024095E2C|nr:uncharacterized protein LOC129224980 [Uloborus diversus]